MKNHYVVLGLTSSASASEIRKAFRRLARKIHPDVNDDADAAEQFIKVAEAYAVLGNEVKRKAYDASRSKMSVAFIDELLESTRRSRCKVCPTCHGEGFISDELA